MTPYIAAAQKGSGFDRWKYIPLSDDPRIYLSFGADLRERVEASNDTLLGYRNRGSNVYDLHRLLVYSDLHHDDFRAFVQIGSHTETGRSPAALPTDMDRGDLQQAFLDYSPRMAGDQWVFRGGRFEMSFDEGALVSLRDGPNVRQVWDGLRTSVTLRTIHVDAFVVASVGVSPGYFDDSVLHGQTLWGIHFQTTPAFQGPVAISGFYYDSTMPKVLLSPTPGREHTHTAGVLLRREDSDFDASIGGIVQTGRFNSWDVLAWSNHGELGWTFSALPGSPRVGLRADALSGGPSTSGTVHTFNALYPNYAFSTQATIEAPSNLIQCGGSLDLHPARSLTLQYKIEGLWRYSVHDAFYAAPTFALVMPSGANERYSGLAQQVQSTWNINQFVSVLAAYVHFAPGAFLQSKGAVNENFGMAQVTLRF